MSKETKLSIQHLLKTNSGLQKMINQAQRHSQLKDCVQNCLEPYLAGEIRTVTLNGAKLVIVTANASVAAKLRQQRTSLQQQLLQQDIRLDSIEITVAP